MNTAPVNVILIEDNPFDAELTLRELKKYNLANHFVHLEDGEAALNYFFNSANPVSDHHPKLILLDIKMPKVSGIEVLARLKSDLRTRCIPVVILTSSNEDPDVKKCYELGVNSYIVKPVGFEGFTAAIKGLGNYWLVLNQPEK
jgi:two-component system response regulator